MTKRLCTAVAVAVSLLLFSCKKENTPTVPSEPSPAVEYITIVDSVIKYGNKVIVFDFDGDGFSDLKFGVVLVGDPIEKKDKRQFRVASGISTKFAVNDVLGVPVMNKGEEVPLNNFNGFEWWLVSSVILIQRIEDINGSVTWEGQWKGAIKKYLPFQLIKNGKVHTGWAELTVNANEEKIILHRIALSKEPGKLIRVGD